MNTPSRERQAINATRTATSDPRRAQPSRSSTSSPVASRQSPVALPLLIFTFHFSLFAFCFLPACSSGPSPIPQGRAFPPELRQIETLDIQVFRRGTHIEFTNTTARAFPAGTLWLNRRFSRPIAPLAVGQTADLHLAEFQDEFGEPFRAGGFFATREPETLVQAQLETTDPAGKPVLLGLIVVSQP